MGSLTQWTWVWIDSGSCWWTGRPGMLWFMGSQRVGHDWVTELNWTFSYISIILFFILSVHKSVTILLAKLLAIRIRSFNFTQHACFFTVQTRMLLGHLQASVIIPIHWRSQKSSVGIQSYWLLFLLEMQTLALFQGLHYHLLITLSSYPLWTIFILHILAKSSFSLTKKISACVLHINTTPSHLTIRFILSYPCSDCNSKNLISILLYSFFFTSLSTS